MEGERLMENDYVLKKDIRKLVKVGNSVGILIHKDERENLQGIGPGDSVVIRLTEDCRMELEPVEERGD